MLVGGHQAFEDVKGDLNIIFFPLLFSFPALPFEILDSLINPRQYIRSDNSVSKRSRRIKNMFACIIKTRSIQRYREQWLRRPGGTAELNLD